MADEVTGESFMEEELTIGQEPWSLPATLTLPRAGKTFPAVILVHGSGPNDRDETVGPNKPFRDLAWGLASRGIAVLRYEKRTRQYAQRMAAMTNLTVFEETIADVGEGFAVLAGDTRIQPLAIYVLGHSMGGYLIPRIADYVPGLAGVVLWAASSRPLEESMLEQIAYVSGLQETTDEVRTVLATMREQALLIADVGRGERDVAPMGVPASYWRDLADYEPAAQFRAMTLPALVLRGAADYQVTDEDFQRFEAGASNRSNVTLKQYPHLNHCFMWTEGERATPSSYAQPGNVDEAVIADIAAWIHTGHTAP